MLELLRKFVLIDFIVHGIGGPYKNCDIFSYFQQSEKLLIEFVYDMDLVDYSLSRCASFDNSSSFCPDCFKMTMPTPGALNSCSKELVNVGFYLFDCNTNPLESENVDDDDDDRCTVLINELNTGSPGILHNKDFIELFADCTNKKKKSNSLSLQGYKLIGISTGSGASDRMLIDLVVNLWNAKTNRDSFFTIGTPTVRNTEITTESPYVVYRNKFSGSTRDNQIFMMTGNRHLHAIALLYKNMNNFPEITLSMKNPYIVINDDLKDLIKNNLVDVVVYGRKAPYDNCVLFIDLYNDYANMEYILREFDNNVEGIDRTLNRCAVDSTEAFVPNQFKLGLPTPGSTNDCTGTHFILEPHLSDLSDPLQQRPFDSDNQDAIDQSLMEVDNAQCTSSTDLSAYASTSVGAIEMEIQSENILAQDDSCSSLQLGANDGNLAEALDISNNRKRSLSDTTDYETELEWEFRSMFRRS